MSQILKTSDFSAGALFHIQDVTDTSFLSVSHLGSPWLMDIYISQEFSSGMAPCGMSKLTPKTEKNKRLFVAFPFIWHLADAHKRTFSEQSVKPRSLQSS